MSGNQGGNKSGSGGPQGSGEGLGSALALLADGVIPFGRERVALGTPLSSMAPLLGLTPDEAHSTWQEEGVSCQLFQLRTPLGWEIPGAVPVGITFRDHRLDEVQFTDPGWEPSKGGWENFDYEVYVRNYRRSRAQLVEKLGKPSSVLEDSPSLMVVTWKLPGAILTLCCESRTPACALVVKALEATGRGGASRRARLALPEALPPHDDSVPGARKGRSASAMVLGSEGVDQFGGLPAAAIGARWPKCKECGQAMRFLAFFWAHPERLPLVAHEGLAVFLCANEGTVGLCETWAPESGSNAVLLFTREELDTPSGGTVPQSLPEALPLLRFSYHPVAKESPGSRLGGEPDWVQGAEIPKCQRCRKKMIFVGQIDGSLHDRLNFGDAGAAFLFVCPGEHQAKMLWQGA